MIRELGSLAVFDDVFFAFIPFIRAQNDLRRPASFSVFGFGAGGFRFIPCFLADARPLAFNPPSGFLPSALCHTGDFAMMSPVVDVDGAQAVSVDINPNLGQHPVTGDREPIEEDV